MPDQYRVTGLMSGSSMDGVDLACCDFILDGSRWTFNILAADTLPYPSDMKEKLAGAWNLEAPESEVLDLELGGFYAALLNQFHRTHGLKPQLIASHGHTLLHEPDRGITLQAGNGRVMAEKTGIMVVNDFRKEDVAQGGQGAPLVPIGDLLLFSAYDACLNLGGFANISYDDPAGRRVAFDLCPANMALNWIAGLKGLEYDEGGLIARAGQVDHSLLNALNNLGYYSKEPPKSLGREWFLSQFHPLLLQSGLAVEDLMATTVEHIAWQIALGSRRGDIRSMLVTGGGALNRTLVERLMVHTPFQIEIPGLNLVRFKEALVFAFLGLLRIRGEVNCLSSVTGGARDLSAGTIFRTNKKQEP